MMELKEMTIDELQERKAQIAIEADAPEADLDALTEEVRAINEEVEARKKAEAQRVEIREAVANGAGVVVETITPEIREEKSMEEIRNSAEYINAYAEFIKTGNDAECRALITENTTNGTVPVPELVYDIVKTAWEKDGIISRVRKAYIKGNLKVGFEISSSEAAIHTEGQSVNEESLVLGVVNLVPESIKKWISVSDEVMDMRGEAFLRYIYDELAYRIAKKAADTLVSKILACGTASTSTCPGVPSITAASVSLGTVAAAMAQLSDEAANPVIIMNKLTWGAFKAAAATNNYAYDPFEGLPIAFNDSLTAFAAATTGVPYMIVGDLDQGALANFPSGAEIDMKYDEYTLATSDLVRIIGRQFVAIDVIAPNAFVTVKH